MKPDPKTSPAVRSRAGFQIASEPRVPAQVEEELPANSGADRLCLMARDPHSLFIYWDVNWARLFAAAGLSPRAVHLRIHEGDSEIESTREVNPFRGHCYVEVARSGASYSGELGCFAGEKWIRLIRSARASTPRGEVSDDLSTTFATLPLHLSFQRMIELLELAEPERANLALAVAESQNKTAAPPGGTAESSELAEVQQRKPEASAKARSETEPVKWEELTQQIARQIQEEHGYREFGGRSSS